MKLSLDITEAGDLRVKLDDWPLDKTMTQNFIGFFNSDSFKDERNWLADQLEEILEEGK